MIHSCKDSICHQRVHEIPSDNYGGSTHRSKKKKKRKRKSSPLTISNPKPHVCTVPRAAQHGGCCDHSHQKLGLLAGRTPQWVSQPMACWVFWGGTQAASSPLDGNPASSSSSLHGQLPVQRIPGSGATSSVGMVSSPGCARCQSALGGNHSQSA